MLERNFQSKLIKRIKSELPGSIVFKNDANYIQGFPDLTIFYKNRYAMLECKRSANDPHRPNQDYYVRMVNDMAFCSFIYPENEKEVLTQLKEYMEDAQ